MQNLKNLDQKNLQTLVADFISFLAENLLIVLVSFTVLLFMFNIVKYMFKGQESDQARKEGKNVVFWSLIGLTVIISMWAIVAMLSKFFGHDGTIFIPQF